MSISLHENETFNKDSLLRGINLMPPFPQDWKLSKQRPNVLDFARIALIFFVAKRSYSQGHQNGGRANSGTSISATHTVLQL